MSISAPWLSTWRGVGLGEGEVKHLDSMLQQQRARMERRRRWIRMLWLGAGLPRLESWVEVGQHWACQLFRKAPLGCLEAVQWAAQLSPGVWAQLW